MKKLFELTNKDFFSGLSQLSHGLGDRLFFAAKGVSPIVNPFAQSNDFGLLQTSSAPVDMTGAVVVDIIIAWAVETVSASEGYLYGFGSSGNFYVIDIQNNTVTNERSGGSKITNSANGLRIYRGKLYYAQKTQIGQCTEGTPPFDTSSTWDNDWSVTTAGAAALTSSIHHPLHLFSARLWAADTSSIDVISGTTPDYAKDVITFENDYRVLCLNDDGQFLVAGLTQNLGDITKMAKSKIVFWDTFSVYPNKEHLFPEANITAIVKGDGGWMYALGGRGFYRFTYSTPPQAIIHSMTTAETIAYGRCFAADNFIGNTVIWGGGSNQISMYGSAMAGYKPSVLHPFTGWGDIAVIALTSQAKSGSIYFSTSDSKLYRQDIDAGGATGLSATTNFISLPEKTKIEEIKLILGTDLASGDSLNIDVSADSVDTATDWGTVSFTAHGAVRRITLHNTFDAEDLQLVLNYNGGNVKIKKIEVWGTSYPKAIK